MQEQNNGWRVDKSSQIIYIDKRVNGKRVKFSTCKKATPANLKWIARNWQEVLSNYIYEKVQSKKRKPSSNLQDFGIEILKSRKGINETSRKELISLFNRLIIPYFRDFPMGEIETIDIETWQNSLSENGYSTQIVNRARNILNVVLKKAKGYKLISDNPIDYADTVTVVHKETIPYSVEEVIKILKSAKGWLHTYLHVAFTSGMRAGEIIGLKWDDIDFDTNTIFLKRSISKGKITETTSTKNHKRLVILPDITVMLLKKHKEDAINEWVFPSTRGNRHFYDAKTVLEYFKEFIKKIDVPYRALKATRHSYTSIMRNEGGLRELAAEIAGHSPEVADKHYSTPKVNSRKINAVNNVFSGIGVQNIK